MAAVLAACGSQPGGERTAATEDASDNAELSTLEADLAQMEREVRARVQVEQQARSDAEDALFNALMADPAVDNTIVAQAANAAAPAPPAAGTRPGGADDAAAAVAAEMERLRAARPAR